jgi:hypothetical protein
LILAGGISVLGAQEIQQLNLTTKLANPIQKIQKIMFVVPIGTGSTWKTTGQVEVSARENKVTVNGSLITNVQSGNKVSGTSLKNSSLLGGVDNEFPSNVTGSAIVGGKNNEIKSDTATVLGGDGNTINPNSVRSTII